MQITDVPVEILVIIIKKLDFKSVYSLYKTCSYFKNIICMYNVVKTADLALNNMASTHFLKLSFMKDISRNLQNLDLRGMVDLNKTCLLMAVGGMKCLKTLDVSYTNITLFDLYEVYKKCPTIKNIGCNFVFGKKKDVKPYITKCQNLFQNFDKVHLVGNAGNLFYSNLGVWVLQKACLSQLQLSIVENCGTVYGHIDEADESDINLNFKFISMYILNEWKIPNSYSGTIFSMPNLLKKEEKYECIVIISDDCQDQNQIYVSPMFKKFFESYNAKSLNSINIFKHIINGVIMLWDKEQNVFDDVFFQELKTKLNQFFPYEIKDDRTVVPTEYDKVLFRIPPPDAKANVSTDTLNFKKKRLAPESYTLNHDTVFSNHKKVHLTLFFPCNASYPVNLSSSSQFLKKLNFLHLTGYLRYSTEFFNVLFRCCEHLETLNVEDSPYVLNTSIAARNIPLSRSLKNLRLAGKRIDFDLLFSSLSQCSTLENIHIVDSSRDNNALSDPSTIFEKCHNLYCICIFASMSTAMKARKNQLFKNLRTRYGKWYMHVELCTGFYDTKYNYDPCADVFNVNSIKPIEQLY